MTVRLLMASRVAAARLVTPGVREIEVVPRHRAEFPPFRGGDHVQVQHMDGTRRDYSLIGPPTATDRYRIAVLRQPAGRGGSLLFHDDLDIGDEVYVSYPQPGFEIDTEAGHHVFVAGGIGVTAILGLLHELPAGSRGEVHYCVPSAGEAAYLPELAACGLPLTVHDSSAGSRLDVGKLVARLPSSATIYHCGPGRLMAAIEAATADRAPERVRGESFSTAVPPGERRGEPFQAHLTLSRKAVSVAADESLLHALHRHDVRLEYSCEGGICGTCVLQVLDGEVEHRDACLSGDERAAGYMTTCVSRGRGDISLLM
ncbi:PDR/VanB family oxidoreductase [Streptomyces aurantiacus]|uniref:Putative Phenoxybenzoate dioxygenase subunit beta n=1 Tax=Streptomyces aurantiacus JA 4570 TaxID=1286094 RepID=S4A184_9ACTN|nr:PDR/VanB family oxidoreductase [Streptomyces aurantiacus]EPH44445.1 putative Phenoxybenzoate dioxygenase subunit beta [Streptomyces aurantiacus JA 4570]